MRQSNPDFQLIGSNSTVLFGSNQANELAYTAGGEKKRHCTLFTIIADKVYRIDYEAYSQYPACLSIAQKIVNSIEFLSTAATETAAATNQTRLNSTLPNRTTNYKYKWTCWESNKTYRVQEQNKLEFKFNSFKTVWPEMVGCW